MAVQERHTDALFRVAGVVGTATTIPPDGRYAVKVLTRRGGMERLFPESLDGVPVVVEEVGDIKALAFTGKFDPVPAGVSIGNKEECGRGTLGAVVTRDGAGYFLSNNHVLARENNAAIGEDIVQPGLDDSVPQCDPDFPNHVADLSAFKRISFLPVANNRNDAAIAQIRAGLNFTCETACGYTPGNTPKAAVLDMDVKKCGRSTELTTGTVTGLNVSVLVNYGVAKVARFTGQIEFSDFADFTGGVGGLVVNARGGDSGSLVVDQATNDPVALLFAGSATKTFGNPIGEVLNNFGVTICDA